MAMISSALRRASRFARRRLLRSGQIAAALALLCSCSGLPETSPEAWTWVSAGASPVFVRLDSVEEGAAIGSPDVVATKGPGASRIFCMAYAQGGRDHRGRIGLAESSDGIAWTRIGPGGAPSVLEPASGAWDGWFLDTPCILEKDGTWYLWYFGASSNDTPGGAIGLATSSDGLSFVRAAASPVLSKGAAGDWDGLWVESPSVAYDGNHFVMYYTGVDASWRPRVGRATSDDGISWVKDSANPVLDRGGSGAWDGYAAAVPAIALVNGEWQMFYCGISELDAFLRIKAPKIGLAVSSDGRGFARWRSSPIVDGSIDGNAPNGPYNPSVLFDSYSNRYYLWYENGYGFGLATAPPRP
jgi:Predicted glycosylase